MWTKNATKHGLLLIILTMLILYCGVAESSSYHVGVGIADCTGPVAEVGLVSLFFILHSQSSFDIVLNYII